MPVLLSLALLPSSFLFSPHQMSLRMLTGAFVFGFVLYGLKSDGFTDLLFLGSRRTFAIRAINEDVCPHSNLPRASVMRTSSRKVKPFGSTPQIPAQSQMSRSTVPARRPPGSRTRCSVRLRASSWRRLRNGGLPTESSASRAVSPPGKNR